MPLPAHLLSEFDSALNDIADRTLRMGSLCREALDYAVRGLIERDAAALQHSGLCLSRLPSHDAQGTQRCLAFITRFQPVSGDLRTAFLSARARGAFLAIGDDIQELLATARHLLEREGRPESRLLEPLATRARSALGSALSALAGNPAPISGPGPLQEDDSAAWQTDTILLLAAAYRRNPDFPQDVFAGLATSATLLAGLESASSRLEVDCLACRPVWEAVY